jgi:hypothetical protein
MTEPTNHFAAFTDDELRVLDASMAQSADSSCLHKATRLVVSRLYDQICAEMKRRQLENETCIELLDLATPEERAAVEAEHERLATRSGIIRAALRRFP